MVDLLPHIDLAQHASAGWRREPQSLMSPAKGANHILVGYTPPEAFRLEIDAKRVEGSGQLAIGLIRDGETLVTYIDASQPNVETPHTTIGSPSQPFASVAEPVLPAGAKFTVKCEVSSRGVKLFRGNRLLLDAPAAKLSGVDIDNRWRLAKPPSLFLATDNAAILISRLELFTAKSSRGLQRDVVARDVGGKFQPLGAASRRRMTDQLQEKFGKRLASTDAFEMEELAADLLIVAKAAGQPAKRLMAFELATDRAARAGDVERAFRAVEAWAEFGQIDIDQTKVAVLGKTIAADDPNEADETIAERGVQSARPTDRSEPIRRGSYARFEQRTADCANRRYVILRSILRLEAAIANDL